MKKQLIQMIKVSLIVVLLIGINYSVAQTDTSKQYPEKQTTKNTNYKADMMGKMDMHQMMGMMNQCMGMHKNNKMCDSQAMEKCQQNMGQEECMKMMEDIKKEEKATKTKK